MEELKQCITAKSYRVRRYITQQKLLEQNQLFMVNQKTFFISFPDDNVEQTPLDSAEETTFWSDHWGVPVVYNKEVS